VANSGRKSSTERRRGRPGQRFAEETGMCRSLRAAVHAEHQRTVGGHEVVLPGVRNADELDDLLGDVKDNGL
jgi:hypothetical protein